jgi:hypothetical protein
VALGANSNERPPATRTGDGEQSFVYSVFYLLCNTSILSLGFCLKLDNFSVIMHLYTEEVQESTSACSDPIELVLLVLSYLTIYR